MSKQQLEDIKDKYAKEQGFDSYDELVHLLTYGMANKHTVQFHYYQIAKRYAKAVLERAADNARMKTVFTKNGERTTINKQSILNTDLE